MKQPVFLEPPPNWTPEERPMLPGSPAAIYHRPSVRAAYAAVGVLVGITGGLGNALVSANLPQIQGQLGLTPSEGAWLPAAYVMVNVTSNLLLFKFRQQFGIRRFAELGIFAYVMVTLLHVVAGALHGLPDQRLHQRVLAHEDRGLAAHEHAGLVHLLRADIVNVDEEELVRRAHLRDDFIAGGGRGGETSGARSGRT